MTKFLDGFTGKGTVSIKQIKKSNNEVVNEFTNHNLIVKVGRAEIINLLCGDSTKKITKMAIGKGGANLVSSPFVPVAPKDEETALLSYIGEVPISTKNKDLVAGNPKVTFIAMFDSDKVKSLVNECGLVFDTGNILFARHTFKTVSLEAGSDFALQITWTIEF